MKIDDLIYGMRAALFPVAAIAVMVLMLYLLVSGIRDEQTARFNILIGKQTSGYNSNDLKTNLDGTVTFSPVKGFWKNPITVHTSNCIIITRQ